MQIDSLISNENVKIPYLIFGATLLSTAVFPKTAEKAVNSRGKDELYEVNIHSETTLVFP